jgi:hypothetical protein
MARGNRSSLFSGLSIFFYLFLLFAPLALVQQAHAQSDQDPLQESYGTGELAIEPEADGHLLTSLRQLLVSIWAPHTPVWV